MSFYKTLEEAVQCRLAIVADHAFRDRDSAAHLDALQSAAARLDELVAALPSDADPTLRHYLERQSYIKALAWLQDNDAK